MRLLSLNLWGGKQGQPLFDYLQQESVATDIFCFQEVFTSKANFEEYEGYRINIFKELEQLFPGFKSYFSPTFKNHLNMKRTDFELSEGKAMFVKNNIELKNLDSVYIFGQEETEIFEDFTNAPENTQIAKLTFQDKDFVVANVHGKWHPGDKKDSPERIEQSQKILKALQPYSCPKIICGDFNLLPETESIKLLDSEYKNLIKDFKITSTRNKVSWDLNKNIQHYADFTFVSSDIKVKSFAVPYNEVSDHLPMILDFSLKI